ncbi:MAG: XylR family transcriptional regulator [Planctomycetota bacterium]|nr:XylR family transcriptional regulator [Planctomycetota bacterium]
MTSRPLDDFSLPTTSSQKIPHVVLLIETSRTYTRNLLRGVRRYISEHGPWSVYLEMRALDSRVPVWLSSWKGDGILCRSSSVEMVEAIRQTQIPTVELRSSRIQRGLPFVGVDNSAFGKLVADHFIERGLRNFACFELDVEQYFEDRRDSFVQYLASRGYSCDCYRSPDSCEQPTDWESQQCELADWLSKLPKPIGIMACNDQLGFWLLDACNRSGIMVPDEIAVVGAEDDESLCDFATPPMSSVHFPGAQIGYAAAALLDRLMAGEAPPSKPLLIAPYEIVVRKSSDTVAVDDPIVAQALRFIRKQARYGCGVEDVCLHVGVSRRTLERRMRAIVGRSPLEEIRSVKVDCVRQLVLETDLSLEKIAHLSGFSHAQDVIEAFRNRFHMTPGQFRRSVQIDSTPAD